MIVKLKKNVLSVQAQAHAQVQAHVQTILLFNLYQETS